MTPQQHTRAPYSSNNNPNRVKDPKSPADLSVGPSASDLGTEPGESGELTIGQRVKRARGTIMRQSQLAMESGVSDRTISTIEKGVGFYKPKAETVARLAIALKVDPMEWVGLCEDSSDFTAEDVEQLRQKMLRQKMTQTKEYRPADELLAKMDQEIARSSENLEKTWGEKLSDLESDIERVKTDSQGLPAEIHEQFAGKLNEVLNSQYEPANKLKDSLRTEFLADLSQVDTRLTNRVDDLRRLVNEMGERISLLTSLVQALNRS